MQITPQKEMAVENQKYFKCYVEVKIEYLPAYSSFPMSAQGTQLEGRQYSSLRVSFMEGPGLEGLICAL